MSEHHFIVDVSTEFIKREKEKARALRKTRWWQLKISKGQCYYCGATVPPNELTMDHIVPLIRGGRSTKSNIVPACKDCNNKKKMDAAGIPSLEELIEMAQLEGVKFVACKMTVDMMELKESDFIDGVSIQTAEEYLKHAINCQINMFI